MKKIFLLPLLLLLTLTLSAQNGGWRDHEMEIRIFLSGQEDFEKLRSLRLNGDIYPDGKALFYVVPQELQNIKELGLSYEVQKEDLNEYFKDFWLNRDEYHSYDEIIQVMNSLAFGYSGICRKYIYGTSVEGRELSALKISDNVGIDESEPEVGFDGGIHGDEIGASENLIRFAQHLCESYGVDPEITDLIDTREIWLYIMVNPDGRVHMSRANANGVDLNRDWGYMWNGEGSSPGAYSQVESKALRSCFYDNQFVVHTTYHSGTEYVSYPWSYRPDQCPDQAHIDQLASVYSSVSGYANLTYQQGYNGMYPINGSSKDTYYAVMGSIGWTMEISYDKQPPTSQIQHYYSINVPSMLAMIEYSGYGIEGTVTDAVTGDTVQAMIFINDYFPTYNDPETGDYHKYILQGSYTVTAVANGYAPMTKNNIVVNEFMSTECNFALQGNGEKYAYRISACQIPDNNYADEGFTPAALGPPDNVNYSIGKNGWVVLDMGESILDGPGSEIRVVEGDDTDEGYSCYAGPSIDGPWAFLGNGWGTENFNFQTANVLEARFIMIDDDNDGAPNVDNAGFDLDAIEILEQPQIVFLKLSYEIDDQAGNDNGRLDPGETADLIVSLRNHGGLTAGNVTGNLNYDSAWINIPEPDAVFGDIGHAETGQAVFTIHVDASAPLEEIIMMVLNITANEGTFTESFLFGMNIGAFIEDWETNNFEKFDWSFTNVPWVISPLNAYEGQYTAKSANIGNNQKSGLQISLDVTGYDDISFYRKVSSENGFDFLNFYIDGTLAGQWSGDMAWELVSYDVTPGYHTFKWTFTKDEGVSHGYDCGWVDYITFPSFNPDGSLHVIANAFPHEYCVEGESQLGAYIIGGSGSNTFAWTPDEYLSSTTARFPVANPPETTVYTVEVDDGIEIVTAGIKVSVHPAPETPVIEQQGDSIISSAPEGNQWYDSNGLIPDATAQVFYPEEEDAYYVIVTSQFGCVSDTSNTVNFLFTDITDLVAGNDFVIYPNPVGQTLHIRSAKNQALQVDILDIVGKVVLSGRFKQTQTITIPFGGLCRGIYLISITGEDGRLLLVEKVIK